MKSWHEHWHGQILGVAKIRSNLFRVSFLQERDLSHKLESLFAKNLFGVALNIAESELVRSCI